MKRKLCSVLLALCMVLTLLPVSAMADETEQGEDSLTTISDTTLSTENEVYDGSNKVLKNGTLTVTANNVTVKNLTFGDGALLNVNTAGSFTLTNCTFNSTTYVRTPVTLNVGSATVTGNTFAGTQANGAPSYYNAIEFAVSYGNKLSSATLSDNKFEAAISNNYFSTYYYANSATITVENNDIKLANRGSNAIRISNVTNSDVTFNLRNNTYSYVDNQSDYEGFILLQDFTNKNGTKQEFSKVTINISNLTSPSDANRLFYVWEDNVGIISNNNPVIKGDSSIEKFFVAKVDDTYYKTLAEAVAAANNATVTLLKDVTANVTIPADETITLNLNGNDITVNDGCAIVNKGTLTVTGSGNVTTSADESAAVANFPDAIATLNGGTYSSSNWYVIKNLGTMTIDGPVTVKKPDNSTNTASLIDNGWVNGSDTVASESVTAQANKAKLTIKNGAFEGKSGSASCSVVKNDDYGVLEITGGTFDSTNNVETSNATTILNWNVATISGGTFKGSYPISNGSYNNEADQGLLTISGGDFIGTSSLFGQAQGGTSGAGKVTITDGSFEAPQFGAFNYALEITGGTFSFDPSTKVKNNGTDYIVKRAGSEGAYTYTVLAKSGLTSGVYLTDPSGALASNYYVSSTANGVWTVSYSAPYSGGSSSYDPTYSVSTPSKTENGSVTVSPKNASKGDTVTITVKPDSGYVLETLTVTDKNGNELTLKDKGDGKYTFTMPAGKVEVKATFMEDNSVLNFFYDVPNDAYFYEAVKWAVKNGITTGVGNDLFAPEQPCTRAQIVTFLWRAAGSPEPKGTAAGMTDVVSGSYYEKAVAWAIENGITTGTTTSTFSPDATCTRAQSVTFLHRALKGTASGSTNFTDVASDAFYADAVNWAVANNVTNGTSNTTFSPNADCTRAEIVTFLYRAYQGK